MYLSISWNKHFLSLHSRHKKSFVFCYLLEFEIYDGNIILITADIKNLISKYLIFPWPIRENVTYQFLFMTLFFPTFSFHSPFA